MPFCGTLPAHFAGFLEDNLQLSKHGCRAQAQAHSLWNGPAFQPGRRTTWAEVGWAHESQHESQHGHDCFVWLALLECYRFPFLEKAEVSALLSKCASPLHSKGAWIREQMRREVHLHLTSPLLLCCCSGRCQRK